ncbi:glycoside hydrolase family 3 protein [Kribbella deserti]|uniref:Glycoside hydrolase family 3 protein n=1 Tax=Kribbella deserti TaxID=1926257 RepID=A0ABV6QIG1_9ACTN
MRWIDELLGRLTPAQKLAQLVLVLPGVESGRPDAATREALELGVGVLHSVRGMPASAAARYHNAVAEICADAGLPTALLGGNLESGLAYSLGTSGTHFPYPRGIGLSGDTELAYRIAAAGAIEARAVGFHWTFSPCVDVITVPDDPILGIRAYGVSAELTAELGAAQIRGYQDHGVLATAKHFPGHGDSSVDSHLDLPRVDRTAAAHEDIHLAPFRAAVEAGVATIMVAHLELPKLGINEPATLSSTVNRQWLRSDLGFDGVIITDALEMAAVANRYDPAESAVLALRAGADVLNVKCPAGEGPRIIARLVEALAAGEVDEKQVDESLRRLFLARARIGLDDPQPVDEERAAALDEALTWHDPARSSTVSVHGAPVGLDGFAVVGESALAQRFTEIGVRRGVAASGDAVVAVVSPGTVPLAQQREIVASALAEAGDVAAVVINSGEPAETFGDLADHVVTTAAVDAFDIVNDAAIDAAFDVLTTDALITDALITEG